jgi:hypothetical protein
MNSEAFESLLNDYSADHVMVGFCCAARNMDLARYYADKRDASKKKLLAAFRGRAKRAPLYEQGERNDS